MRLTGNRCQCTGCGEYFNSTSTFDRHRTDSYERGERRRCRTPDELILRGWSKNPAGFWIERTRNSPAVKAACDG
jgi:hypothetical protein